MELRFSPLFSGSSGNAVYVAGPGCELLIDAGVSCARIAAEMNAIGANPRDISAILITHEHIDHIRGAGTFARKFGARVYATAGTWSAMRGKIGALSEDQVCVIERDRDFFLGQVNVQPFETPHDANESVGYVVSIPGGARFALATDIGCVRNGWMNAISGASAVLLESNYDPDMLRAGRYPYDLKKRIMSRRGHLSNDDAAEAAIALIRAGAKRIVLGHLSQENNFPELALKSCLSAMERDGSPDSAVTVAKRDGATGVFSVKSAFYE
jgi:phosphoribosyl 1,2-cyclic phosphodiesterase